MQIDGTIATDLTRASATAKRSDTATEPSLTMSQVTRAMAALLAKPRQEINGKVFSTSELLGQNATRTSAERAIALDIVASVQQFVDAGADAGTEAATEANVGLTLLDGTNPLGSAPSVPVGMSTYPSKEKEQQLITKLADVVGAQPSSICVFPGTLAAIEAAAATFQTRSKGNTILYGTPGWAPFENHMRSKGYTMKGIAYEAKEGENDGGAAMLRDLKNQLDDTVCMVYLSSPQFPTGRSLRASAVTDFIKAVPVKTAVVIDQCYVEYARQGAFDAIRDDGNLLARYPNVVVTRTLSKFYGLAATRIAYSVSNALVAAAFRQQITNPFLSDYMVDAALHTLGDEEYHRRVYQHNVRERLRVTSSVGEGAVVSGSDANFMLVRVRAGTTLNDIAGRLKKKGFVTQQSRLYFDDAYYLVALQTKEADDAQIEALSAIEPK